MSNENAVKNTKGTADGKDAGKEAEKLFSDNYTAEERLKHMQEIEQEQKKKPLVSAFEAGFKSLEKEFEGNINFKKKLPHLAKSYKGLRRIRGDGNCFYRGFLFRLVEEMMKDKDLYEHVKTKVNLSLDYMVELIPDKTKRESEKEAYKFFWEQAVAFIEQDFPKNDKELMTFFVERPEESMYLVWFLRPLAAAYIKHHWNERFCFFVENYSSADEYCDREVNVADRECEQLAVTALCEYLEIETSVEYFDANDREETTKHDFGPQKSEARIHLLYRPGHYDVLYK